MPIEPPLPYRLLLAILGPVRTILVEVQEKVSTHDHPSVPRIVTAIQNLVTEIENLEKTSAS